MIDKDIVSPDSPSVEILSHDQSPVEQSQPSPSQQMLHSVELNSPQSASSIEIISPESSDIVKELSSPSSGSTVEVISPEPENLLSNECHDESVASDQTVIEDQASEIDTNENPDMMAALEAAMVESEKKSETCSSKSSEIVAVDMSDTTSSDIEVIQNRKFSLQSGHTRNSSDQSQASVGVAANDDTVTDGRTQ